ncbi:ABC transporter ATP-binding protein [Desulfoluna spongiiphila]|uniref:Iron complex transport system ATP-binding protein n=1 Tax=Desulfoluna spongiiphila TaxID=419481 RepID=A0A1G5FE39_9BACT|nr:ABC transporter ATP-binding protein [Desulfoluna spongiiphila]SCY37463.1 iron complex transport system ATP-binding protein [Desulfoluna spongiiphila]
MTTNCATPCSPLSTCGLSTGYGDHEVLTDISLSIKRGSFFIIAGPNGTGKTTLLKCLAGLARPRKGEVSMDDTPLSRLSRRELARRIAFLPQSVESAFTLTVREVVLMGRAPHLGMLGFHKEEDLALAEEAMAFTDVLHLADRSVDALSGGEKQRVFISRAVCQQPEFILLDEPTSALDLAHQVRIMDLMERLKHERGTGVVMVSHDLNLAAMYADALCLIHRGAVAALGTPAEVLEKNRLETVYGCRLFVEESRVAGTLRITPVPARVAASTA